VQTAFSGSGVKSFAPPDASRAHARAGRPKVPLAGLQRTVQVQLSVGAAESAQYVMRSVVPDAAAETDAITRPPINSAVTNTRMRPGYCHRP